MKKILLTMALAAFAFSANAQWVIGGNLGFNTTGGKTAYSHGTSNNIDYTIPANVWNNVGTQTRDFIIAPKIGYQINDKIQVGLSISYESYYEKDFNPYSALYPMVQNFEGWDATTNATIAFAPYFRFNCCQFNNFTVFCEAEIAFAIGMPTKIREYVKPTPTGGTWDTSYTSNSMGFGFGFSITPGLNYKFNEHFSADLYIDLLGISYEYYGAGVVDFGGDKDAVLAWSDSRFGLNANLSSQTITACLTNFRLGFNYHF